MTLVELKGMSQRGATEDHSKGVPATPLYATFPRRLNAVSVDAVVLIALSFLIFGLASLVEGVQAARISLVVFWWLLLFFYEPLLVWRLGGTAGHFAMNLRVVDNRTEGNVSLLKALARFVVKTILGVASFLTMNFSRRHQAVHDIVTNSSVRIRDAARARPEHYSLGRPPNEPSGARPWLEIWVRPRTVVRGLVGTSRLPVELLLACGSGVVQTIVQAASNDLGARSTGGAILLATVGIGSVWGVFQLHLVAGMLYVVGRWTGTPSLFRHLRTALAWAAVPQVTILSLWMIGTLVFGRLLYVASDPDAAVLAPVAVVQGLLALATLVCGAWWIVLQVLTVAEVQRVSAWRALGNFLVGLIGIGVTAIVIVLLVTIAHR